MNRLVILLVPLLFGSMPLSLLYGAHVTRAETYDGQVTSVNDYMVPAYSSCFILCTASVGSRAESDVSLVTAGPALTFTVDCQGYWHVGDAAKIVNNRTPIYFGLLGWNEQWILYAKTDKDFILGTGSVGQCGSLTKVAGPVDW